MSQEKNIIELTADELITGINDHVSHVLASMTEAEDIEGIARVGAMCTACAMSVANFLEVYEKTGDIEETMSIIRKEMVKEHPKEE